MGQKFAAGEPAPSGTRGWPKGEENGATRGALPSPSPSHGSDARRPRGRGRSRSAAPLPRSGRPAPAATRPWNQVPGSAAPRAAPTRPPRSPAAPAPLSRHPRLLLGRHGRARGRPESAVARGLEAGRRRRGAGLSPPPPPPPSRLRCPSAGLLQAATGEGRPAALSEPEAPPQLPETPGGNGNGHGHSREAPVGTAARGGGACTPLGWGRCCPGPAPGPAPPPARPLRKPPARPRCHRPQARLRASGVHPRGSPWASAELRRSQGSQRGGWCFYREPGREANPRSRKSWREPSGVQILLQGRPSTLRPCGKESGSQNAVSAHC